MFLLYLVCLRDDVQTIEFCCEKLYRFTNNPLLLCKFCCSPLWSPQPRRKSKVDLVTWQLTLK